MERFSWMLQFNPRDGGPKEELHFNTEAFARENLALYDDDLTRELYESIELVRIDWQMDTEEVMGKITL